MFINGHIVTRFNIRKIIIKYSTKKALLVFTRYKRLKRNYFQTVDVHLDERYGRVLIHTMRASDKIIILWI